MPYQYRGVMADAQLGGLSACVTYSVYGLPAGYTLGEERVEGGINYRLVYNAGNSAIQPGYIASPRPVGGGLYSVTVTTVTGTFNHVGAVLAHNATVPTDCYFWGAYRGYIASGLVATSITQLAGNCSHIDTDGCVRPVSNTVAGAYASSGNVAIACTLLSPTAGTVAVRQASVWLNIP